MPNVATATWTVEAIATRAGVSKKTIHRWWPTKGAVVLVATTGRRNQTMSEANIHKSVHERHEKAPGGISGGRFCW